MLELTIFEYFREVKNIFISLFMASLCLLIAILYSFLDYENGKVKPFKSLNNMNGYVTYHIQEKNKESDNYQNKRNILDYEGIAKEYISYKTYFNINENLVESYVYEDVVWDNWHARVKEGRWFNSQDVNKKVIPIVIGGDTRGYRVGDKFTIDADKGVKVEIIGLLQDKTEIFDLETYNYYNFNYSEFYKTPNYKEGYVFALCQAESLVNKNIDMDVNFNWAIYVYDSKLTEEQSNKVAYDLYLSDEGAGKSLDVFIDESEKIARQKVYTYIPTIVVSLLILFAAIYCISYVKIQNSGMIYSIYYLNGASKARIYVIVTGYVILTVLFSVVFYAIGGMWFDAFSRKRNIMYSFWGNSVKLPLLLYLIFGIIMSFCLIVEIRNKTAVELIRQKAL